MEHSRPISLLLVDDSQPFRQGIRTLLNFCNANAAAQFEVVGEAVTAEQALHLVKLHHPMLVLLDMELVQSDGITVLTELQGMPNSPKILALSVHREDEWVFRAMQAGAQGYLCKDHVADQLVDAIMTILRDEVYLSPAIAASFFRLFHFYAGQSLQACRSIHLTDREREVLHWLAQGASNDAIAQHLHVTVATVKAHLTAIFEKLRVTSRTQAIVKALKLGLVSV
ncbi:response regulator [Leptolyngbya sp. AN02str]|uniref:response regulator n=1 Tax=Leptolyngbya sp. AN02str TaxID=3423363 RepID=UPI003D31F2DB